jgi:hypothetical protein
MSEVGNQDQRKRSRICGPAGTVKKAMTQTEPGTSAHDASEVQQTSEQQQQKASNTHDPELAAPTPTASAGGTKQAANFLMAAAKAQAKQDRQEASVKQLTPEEMRERAQRQVI